METEAQDMDGQIQSDEADVKLQEELWIVGRLSTCLLTQIIFPFLLLLLTTYVPIPPSVPDHDSFSLRQEKNFEAERHRKDFRLLQE